MKNRFHRLSSFLLFILFSLNHLHAQEEVVLNPVEISGVIQLGADDSIPDTLLDYVLVNIIANGGTASHSIAPDPKSNIINYSVFVDVPEGGSTEATINPTILYRDNYSEYSILNTKTVTVYDGVPVTNLDFKISEPGFLTSNITINGGTLSGGHIDLKPTPGQDISTYNAYFTRLSLKSGVSDYSVALEAGHYNLDARVRLQDGSLLTFSASNIEILANQTIAYDLNLDAPLTGSVTGTISYPGPEPVKNYHVRLAGSNFSKTQTIPATSIQAGNVAAYNFENVAVGTARLTVSAAIMDNDTPTNKTIALPDSSYESIYSPTHSVSVLAGEAAIVNVNTQQASIIGSINFTGAVNYSDLSSSYHQLRYRSLGTERLASSSDQFAATGTASGTYEIIGSQGEWYLDYMTYTFSNNDTNPAIHTNVRLTDLIRNTGNEAVVVPLTGEVNQDVNIPISSASINARIIGGKLFTNPFVAGGCVQKDATGITTRSTTMSAYSANQVDVTTGIVNLLAPSGMCTLDVFATVDSVQTLIAGDVTIEFVPGVDQDIDIGAPTLTLSSPVPDSTLATNLVTVTGTSVDDVEVASVTVNGLEATLTPVVAGDLSSVGFSHTGLSLVEGNNTITVTTTDTSGNSATQTLTVSYEPVISNTAPVANDIQASVDQNNQLLIELSATDVENDDLSFTISINPSNGTLTLNTDGTYTYTPNTGYFGVDTFTFVANDGEYNSEAATVSIIVKELDSDGDGIPDGSDICPGTVQGAINDSNSCSIAQLCPCSGPKDSDTEWRNHGKYVSCVSKAAKSFIKQGLLIKTDHGVIVAEAARSSCGKPVQSNH